MSFADTARDEYERAGLDQEIKTLREQLASARKGLEGSQRALASCRHLIRKYIPAHDWVSHIDEDIELVKAALKDLS